MSFRSCSPHRETLPHFRLCYKFCSRILSLSTFAVMLSHAPPSWICAGPPFTGTVYFIEYADPFAPVPVIVVCTLSPCSSLTTVRSLGGAWAVVRFVFAVLSLHVPTKGLSANNVPANASSAKVQITLCNVLLLGGKYITASEVSFQLAGRRFLTGPLRNALLSMPRGSDIY